MAEILNCNSSKKTGVRKSKKLSTKVDLTPMVDLGFLLITFFIFTTTLNEPKVLTMIMPSNEIVNPPTQLAKSKVLQLVLTNNNQIKYYEGNDPTNYKTTNFSNQGLRDIIQQKQKKVAQQFGNKKEMVLIIKPTNQSNYKNLIDVMDEVLINQVTHYVLSDIDKKDESLSF